jgi:hypothetical protein
MEIVDRLEAKNVGMTHPEVTNICGQVIEEMMDK